MILVLDTNALWHAPLLRALSRARERGLHRIGELEVLLPALVFAERARQVGADEDRLSLFGSLLDDVGARIEPFGREEGGRVANREPNDAIWKEHARDFLIAAHVHSGRVGVTDDRGPGWQEVGTLTPAQAARAVRALVGA